MGAGPRLTLEDVFLNFRDLNLAGKSIKAVGTGTNPLCFCPELLVVWKVLMRGSLSIAQQGKIVLPGGDVEG